MKILFDGQIFVGQAAGGISRYYTTLATQLNAEASVSARIIAPLHRNEILSAHPSAPVLGLGLPNAIGVDRLCALTLRATSSGISRLCHPDVVHETYFAQEPFLTSARRRVTTVYDMIHEIYYPNSSTSQDKRATLARCDHVICISENTKKDLCEFFGFAPERATVTHLAYDDFSGFIGAARPPELSKPYFLYVGNRAGHKNFEMFVRAFASAPWLARNFGIACFGGGRLSEGERALASKVGLLTDSIVHLTGGDDVLGAAYANAAAFVYPSLYEGFGIPPLEAMSAGCPTLCSNNSSLPEVVGDAALLFDPKDMEALRDALLKLADSVELRQDLIRRGHARRTLFSWERCVAQTLGVYRSLL